MLLEKHMLVIHKILNYLKSALRNGLISKHGYLEVEEYIDVHWVGSIINRRSTLGYYMLVGRNLVTWHTKKQYDVARSFFDKQIIRFYKQVSERRNIIAHRRYTMKAKRSKQKERKQKATPSLSKNLTNQQNHLKT